MVSREALMWRHPWQWLSRFVLIAVIIWCASYALWDAHDRTVWRERGVKATALVTDVSYGGEGSFVQLDVEGTSRAILPCPSPPPRIGDRVEVVYDSRDKSQVRMAQQFERVSGRVLLFVAAGTTVFFAMLELVWSKERHDERRAA